MLPMHSNRPFSSKSSLLFTCISNIVTVNKKAFGIARKGSDNHRNTRTIGMQLPLLHNECLNVHGSGNQNH